MNCRSVKEWTLSRRDEPLAVQDERAFQSHLADCADCAVYAREIAALGQLLTDLPLAAPSESFDWRLRLALSRAEREAAVATRTARSRFSPSALQFGAAAAAAAIAVFVGGTWLLPNGSQPPATTTGGVARTVSAPANAGGRTILVSDGAPIGPQPAPSYSYFMQAPQAPDAVADSSVGIRAGDAPVP